MAQLRKLQHKNKAQLMNELVDQRTKCEICKQLLKETDKQLICYKEQSYHIKCFRCSKCRRSMQGLKVYSDEEAHAMYCEKCYLKMLDKCNACGKEIFDQMVTVGDNRKLHLKCFKCDRCSVPLEAYIEKENVYFCENCYLLACLPKCARCQNPLRIDEDGRTIVQISYRGQCFHPECFLCDGCMGNLDMDSKVLDDCNKKAADQSITVSCARNGGANNSKATSTIDKAYYPIDGKKFCKTCALAQVTCNGANQ